MAVTRNVAASVRFLAKTQAIRVRASGSYVNGRWVRTVDTQDPIMIHHQPVSGEDLQRLGEGGSSTVEMRTVWTEATLRVADHGATYESDLLVFDNKNWAVTLLLDRQEYGAYTKAIVSRSDVV